MNVGRGSIALVLLLVGTLAWADFKEAYKDGVTAAERRDWPRVKQLMQQAIAAEPRANPRVRLYGMRFEPYLPQYYLALAEFGLGNCPAALAALADASLERALSEASGVDALRRRAAEIQSRCAAASPPATTTPATTTPAAPSAPTAPTAPSAPSLDLAEVGRLEQRQREASQRLDRHRDSGGDGGLARQYAALQQQSRALGAELAEARQSGRGDLDAVRGRLERFERELAAYVERQQQVPASTPAERPSTPTTPPTPSGPPPAFLRLVESFLGGQYEQVRRWQIDASWPARVRAHGFYLRAAARYQLYVLNGELDPRLLAEAQQDLREARRLDPNARLPRAVYSPRFLALLEAAR